MRHSREVPLADRRARVGERDGESRGVGGVEVQDGEKEAEAEEEDIEDAPFERLPVTPLGRSWRSFAIFSDHSDGGLVVVLR